MPSYFLAIDAALPVVGAILVYLLPKNSRKMRNILTMAITVLTSALILLTVLFPCKQPLVLIDFGKEFGVTLRLSMSIDGLGRFFGALIALLWPFATLYAFGYMEKEKGQPVFFLFYTLAFGAACGVAFAGNLLTMYVFFELLTLTTFPLVMHGHTKEHRRAATRYAAYSFGGAAFGFMGLMYILFATGSTEFMLGGVFTGVCSPLTQVMFLVCFFGFGVKAAVFPLSFWLPAASVAPTPVTALLHAVAVVKSGAFAVIRLVYYCFGADFLSGSAAAKIAMGVALFTCVYGSARALRSGHFKRRLAWSTVSNLSYILAGCMLCSLPGLYGALMHMAAHAVTKMCSFLCAGAFMHATEKERISDMEGVGRKMPVTFCAFALSACSLVGVPLFVGFCSKWTLMSAALEKGGVMGYITVLALLVSALLTAVYMFTPLLRAFFPGAGKDLYAESGVKEVNLRMLTPILLFASATVVLGVWGTELYQLITGLF